MIVLILAGGLGSRLRDVVPDRPKPLADIQGRPFLSHLLDYFLKFGCVRQFVISVGYKGEMIEAALGSAFSGVPITYVREKELLGTGGAIRLALKEFSPKCFPILVVNGDTFLEFDLHSLLQTHQQAALDLSIVLREVPDSGRYGVAQMEGDCFLGFQEKISQGPAWINGGTYLLSHAVFEALERIPLEKFSWEAEVLGRLGHLSLNVRGFKSGGWFIDIGIPEDYRKAQKFLPDYF